MKRKFIKYPVTASQSLESIVSDDSYRVLEDMMYQMYDNYKYEDIRKSDMITMWIEHIQVAYQQNKDYAEDYPELYQEINSLTDAQLRNIGTQLYDKYDWSY